MLAKAVNTGTRTAGIVVFPPLHAENSNGNRCLLALTCFVVIVVRANALPNLSTIQKDTEKETFITPVPKPVCPKALGVDGRRENCVELACVLFRLSSVDRSKGFSSVVVFFVVVFRRSAQAARNSSVQ